MTTPVTDLLPDDVEALKALVEHERARCLTAQDEIERLRSQLRLLLAQRFGAKREVAPEN